MFLKNNKMSLGVVSKWVQDKGREIGLHMSVERNSSVGDINIAALTFSIAALTNRQNALEISWQIYSSQDNCGMTLLHGFQSFSNLELVVRQSSANTFLYPSIKALLKKGHEKECLLHIMDIIFTAATALGPVLFIKSLMHGAYVCNTPNPIVSSKTIQETIEFQLLNTATNESLSFIKEELLIEYLTRKQEKHPLVFSAPMFKNSKTSKRQLPIFIDNMDMQKVYNAPNEIPGVLDSQFCKWDSAFTIGKFWDKFDKDTYFLDVKKAVALQYVHEVKDALVFKVIFARDEKLLGSEASFAKTIESIELAGLFRKNRSQIDIFIGSELKKKEDKEMFIAAMLCKDNEYFAKGDKILRIETQEEREKYFWRVSNVQNVTPGETLVCIFEDFPDESKIYTVTSVNPVRKTLDILSPDGTTYTDVHRHSIYKIKPKI